ncbi:MAG: Sugar kinase, ribokinase family [Candidatus Gottesmanbacteria bacterium GW2011_GWA1_42_26]|nr:MAG: Sugar kinase, ribokinase family [Candidatus Gottesmanbacteria bacterium GW2011_GWA1_42_26]
MKKIFFASVGDLCIDNYLKYNESFPGGTAFNTAVNACESGARASIFSAIGTDTAAQIFQKAFVFYDIDSTHVKIFRGESSSINVSSNNKGQRYFSDWKLGVLKEYSFQPNDRKKLAEFDIAKITLFKPLQKLFDEFCQTSLPSTLKAADFAGSSQTSESIIVIPRYINQLDICIKSVSEKDTNSLSFLQRISIEYKKKILLALLGEKGSIAFLNGKSYKQRAIKTNVKDSNGAGDAYIAHFLISYLRKRDIPQAMFEASKAASEKISKLGAT